MIKLPPHETIVFYFLLEHSDEDAHCWSFNGIARKTALDRTQVKRACRKLAGRGYAKCHHGLWSEDGEPRGSGYAITVEGRLAAAIERQDELKGFVPKCPACETDQVQLVDRGTPAGWRCRRCKHAFNAEPVKETSHDNTTQSNSRAL